MTTTYGGRVDLLGIDASGGLHLLELKRDRTPRDVVAQVLDYGSWVQGLSDSDVRDIFDTYRRGSVDIGFDEAFAKAFGVSSVPDILNETHTLTVVASSMDDSTERLVTYLASGYDVPINVLFFDYYEDDGRSYLARTWLVDPDIAETPGGRGPASPKKQPRWNGRDWYVSFGEEPSRSWDDARRYGFVSAGGRQWFSRTLRQVPIGGRVFAYIPKAGYVGVGEVTGPAQPADDSTLVLDGQSVPFRELDLRGTYRHDIADREDGEDYREWVLPVRWIVTHDRTQALQRAGLFANQNSACKLRNQFTIETVSDFFALDA
ncbi:hypothetical protein [Rhodococcus sp. NPDC004095]